MAIGLYWWRARPASRFGPLLVSFGLVAWLVTWEFADWPLPFDIGVLAEGVGFWLTFYLFLAFPMGRLEPAAARWLMFALAVTTAAFFLAYALLSPMATGVGALLRCTRDCPDNVLQLAAAPRLAHTTGKVALYCDLAIIGVVFVVYLGRIRAASRPQRRALTAVAVTSLLFLPAIFAFAFSVAVLDIDVEDGHAAAWALMAARALMPLGFLIALLQAERFAARTTANLLQRLTTAPTPRQWSRTIADAPDDPSLRLGFYDPGTRRYLASDGERLARPPAGSGRAWVPIERSGRPVAAMLIDETLAENPELVRAAASTTVLAVERGHLEDQLRDSRARILEAGDAERRRIEQDLHDGAQQRLFALRVHLTLTGEDLEPPERAALERLGTEVDEAIEELREVAYGGNPDL